ncbi:unnamed protein product, partial [Ascophyllum nodosum]
LTTYSPYKEKTAMVQKILGSSGISKQTKIKRIETRVAIGTPAIRRTIERRVPRLQRKHKDENEPNKTKVTPEKDVMASANQTPGGYKFTPLVASQQRRANQ